MGIKERWRRTRPLPEDIESRIKGLVRLYRGGGGRTVIHLRPEALGKIRLEVLVENSMASAQVLAENHNVRQSILNDLSLLRETLAQQGIQLENFDVRDGQSQANMAAFDRSDEGTRKGGSSPAGRKNGRGVAPEKAGAVRAAVKNPFGTINLTI